MSNKQVERIYSHGHTPKQRMFMKKTGNKQLRKQYKEYIKTSLEADDVFSDYDELCLWINTEDWLNYVSRQNLNNEDIYAFYHDYENDYWEDHPMRDCAYEDHEPEKLSREHPMLDWAIVTMDDVGLTLDELLRKHNL